ncbi:MAG: aminopeptidase [Euryarchaeota archaeon]|nr:aminopeptidase [Euryarchaeota archaeon]
MRDPRMSQLAKIIVNYSIKLQKGEVVYIETFDTPDEMLEALIEEVHLVGGVPLISQKSWRALRAYFMDATVESMRLVGEIELHKIKSSQAYICIEGFDNVTELSDVPADKMALYTNYWRRPVHSDWRVPNTRWVKLRWPTRSMAQQAEMSSDGFEELYFNTCTLDYRKMSEAMDNLVTLMEQTDRVRLISPGTDLTFSIKGIPAIKCAGEFNLPDGEVFTAPVRNSVNGIIHFNTRTIYDGKVFEDVELTLREGKIISAVASDTEALNHILDTDEGARYIGEFAIGVNPYITRPMLDRLFDEKIAGSIHFTPGSSYDEAFNGNRSAVHWDMVLIQSPACGGGEIYFDDVLIRKDGRFMIKELTSLNPENLID